MDELTKIALVGTSKYAGRIAGCDHPAAVLFAGSEDDDRERSLLLRCGAQAVYELAGHRPVAGVEGVTPASKETKRTPSRKLAALLESALSETGNGLLLDFLSQMHDQQVVLPPELLPVLLETKDQAVRQRLMPLLGERGTWLCRQNPEWSSFVTPLTDETSVDTAALGRILDEGTIDERCQALRALRRRDPLAAREWAQKVLPREKHGHRVSLLKALETGLNAGDEAFLEACLDDRSSAVGQVAASLLRHLPQSAFAERMRSRAGAMFAIEKQGPALAEVKLVCTPPTEIGADWERDGFTRKPPSGVGLRAFWAEHLVASVPPSHWTSHFGLGPQTLVAAVADDAYSESVVSGWTKAAVNFLKCDTESAAWLAPLWQYHVRTIGPLKGDTPMAESTAPVPQQLASLNVRMDELEQKTTQLFPMKYLISLMAPDLAEKGIMSLVEPPTGTAVELALELLPALKGPWSPQFSARFLAIVRDRLQSGTDQAAYRWAAALDAVALAIHADAFPLALEPWKVVGRDESTTWFAAAIPREIDKFIATIEKRQSFLKELNA
jgi:Family of unknown function (DUF5691)